MLSSIASLLTKKNSTNGDSINSSDISQSSLLTKLKSLFRPNTSTTVDANGKVIYKANLGDENTYEYDKEFKRYLPKNMTRQQKEKFVNESKLPPPPPKITIESKVESKRDIQLELKQSTIFEAEKEVQYSGIRQDSTKGLEPIENSGGTSFGPIAPPCRSPDVTPLSDDPLASTLNLNEKLQNIQESFGDLKVQDKNCEARIEPPILQALQIANITITTDSPLISERILSDEVKMTREFIDSQPDLYDAYESYYGTAPLAASEIADFQATATSPPVMIMPIPMISSSVAPPGASSVGSQMTGRKTTRQKYPDPFDLAKQEG